MTIHAGEGQPASQRSLHTPSPEMDHVPFSPFLLMVPYLLSGNISLQVKAVTGPIMLLRVTEFLDRGI